MNVKAILAAKGGDIVSIEPTADLSAAAKLLSEHRIGAVVIRGAGGRLAGILSERDIVRAIADAQADFGIQGRLIAAIDREAEPALAYQITLRYVDAKSGPGRWRYHVNALTAEGRLS